MQKKVVTGAVAVLLWLFAAVPAWADAPVSHARGELLLDGVSGQVLYQQNGYAKAYPASTTKLLTALVAVQHGRLDQVIEVSAHAVDLPPDSSACYLEKGDKQTLQNLLYGLLLVSGNDCAQAIAEGVGGGNGDQFVAWMNETAKSLGAVHSNFTNPHGLHDPAHYTTPQDLALIARAALANPTILKIAGTADFYWPGKSEINGVYHNHNPLLGGYDGLLGGKNGYTEEAGLTLTEVVKRGSRILVGVTMGDDGRNTQYGDMTALLDYGFSDFEQKPLFSKGVAFGSVPVTGGLAKSVAGVAASEFLVSTPKGTQPKAVFQPKLSTNLAAPIAVGDPIGTLEIRDGDQLLGTVPVVASVAVAAAPHTTAKILYWTGRTIKWLALTFLALLVFRTFVRLTRRAIRRRSRQRSAELGRRYSSSSPSASTSAYRSRNRY